MNSSSRESLFQSDLEYEDALDTGRDPNDFLKKLVKMRLQKCGWYDELAVLVSNALATLGSKPTTYKELSDDIIPKAKALVPEELRVELESCVRASLEAKSLFDWKIHWVDLNWVIIILAQYVKNAFWLNLFRDTYLYCDIFCKKYELINQFTIRNW